MTDYEIYSLQSYIDGIEEDLRTIKRAEFEDLNQEKIQQYIEIIKKKKHNLLKFSDEKILKLNVSRRNISTLLSNLKKKIKSKIRKESFDFDDEIYSREELIDMMEEEASLYEDGEIIEENIDDKESMSFYETAQSIVDDIF